jgi:hypothetical protein
MAHTASYEHSTQLVKIFPAFYGSRRLMFVFATIHTCQYLEPDESNPRRHALFLKVSFEMRERERIFASRLKSPRLKFSFVLCAVPISSSLA